MGKYKWLKVTTDRYKHTAQVKGQQAVYRKPQRKKYKVVKRGNWYDVYVYTTEKPLF